LAVLKKIPFQIIALLFVSSCSKTPEKISLIDLFTSSSKTDSIEYYIQQLGFEKAISGSGKTELLFYQKISADSTIAYYTENGQITYGRFIIKNYNDAGWRNFENHIKEINKFEKITGNVILGGKSYHITNLFDLYIEIKNKTMFLEVFLYRNEE
jgi:hypothetical protein